MAEKNKSNSPWLAMPSGALGRAAEAFAPMESRAERGNEILERQPPKPYEAPPLTPELSEGSQHMNEANSQFDAAMKATMDTKAAKEHAADLEHQQRSKDMAAERARRASGR